MKFPGLVQSDFEIFDVPDFDARIARLRAELLPKLALLGEDVAPIVSDVVGHAMFPRAAQHMRRRVNPPPETWVAFARDRRGYKRWTHYRVSVNGDEARVTLFVEDDSDDKPAFARGLARDARAVRAAIGLDAPLEWYTFSDEDAPPLNNGDISIRRLQDRARDFGRVKLRKFQAGIQLCCRGEAIPSPQELVARIEHSLLTLLPLYRLGVPELVMA